MFNFFSIGRTSLGLDTVRAVKSSKVNAGKEVSAEIVGRFVPESTANAIKVKARDEFRYILPDSICVKSAVGSKIKTFLNGKLLKVYTRNSVNGTVVENYGSIARNVSEPGIRHGKDTYFIPTESKAQVLQTVPKIAPEGTFDKAVKSFVSPKMPSETYNIYKNGYYERVSSFEGIDMRTQFRAPINTNIEKYILDTHVNPKEDDAMNIFKSPVVVGSYRTRTADKSLIVE